MRIIRNSDILEPDSAPLVTRIGTNHGLSLLRLLLPTVVSNHALRTSARQLRQNDFIQAT